MPATDLWAGEGREPAWHHGVTSTVTPTSNVDLTNVSDAIHANSTGNVTLHFADGTSGLFELVAGTSYKYRVTKIVTGSVDANTVEALYIRTT